MASALCAAPVRVDGAHGERMDDVDLGAREPAAQVVLAIVVHQEADRAAVHAVDRHAVVQVPVQRLQHQAVAAERDDGVGRLGIGIAVGVGEPLQRRARLRHVARDEGDLVELFALGLSSMGSDPACGTRHVHRGLTPATRRLAHLDANDKPVLIYATFPSRRGGGARSAVRWWIAGWPPASTSSPA